MTRILGCLCGFGTMIILVAGVFGASTRPKEKPSACQRDPTRPFSEYTKCLGHRRVKRNYYGVEGHPCHHYVRLNQPERRTTNKITRLTDSALCDRTLSKRWYRFDGAGGAAMPTSCVEEFSCGTHAPIWLNGKHPTRYGETRDLEVCLSLGGNCCTRRWHIRVAMCGDFHSYLLTEAPGCFMAYCAGGEQECPEGQSSANGYSPGCSENFPKLTSGARAVVSPSTEGHKVAFYCDYEGAVPVGTMLEVQWFVQGDHSGEGDAAKYAVFHDQMVEKRRSILTEGHWMGKLGSTIFCQVRAKWRNNSGVPGPPLTSNKYFAGIKILKRVVNVSENEAKTLIQFQSTMPVTCLPQFKEACSVTVELAHEKDHQAKRCVDGRVRQVVFGDCSVTLTPRNWKEVHNVTVKAVRDFYRDGNRKMRVSFRPVVSTTASAIWNDYEIPEIEILAKDIPTKMCSSTGDPHYSTFDGLYYHVYLEGEFVLYKHTKLPIQVNTRLEKCGQSVTCNCGVAVMAANDVIVIDRCLRQKRNAAFGQSFPEGFRTIHRHAIEQGGDFIKGLKIYEYDEGRRYTVHLPTGAYLEFVISESWINIHLYGSSDDWKSTAGFCGTFDGNKYNDFLHADLLTQSDARDHGTCGDVNAVCAFAESWRVEDKDSFFGRIIEVPLQKHEFFRDEQYCKCERNSGNEADVVCDYHYDINNCQAEEQQRRGQDKTGELLLRSRRQRSAELHDEDDEYFESQFVYDPYFRGEEPSWPTPSGIDEEQAIRFCIDFLTSSELGGSCNRVIGDELARIVDACATDIKVTDGYEWAKASLSTYTSECMDGIHQNASFWVTEGGNVIAENATSPGQRIIGKLCPNDCFKRGVCREGKCFCVDGRIGNDCSRTIQDQPHISYVSEGGLCMLRSKACKHLRLYGTGFRKETRLSCLFLASADDRVIETTATFDTFEEVVCQMPAHDVSYKDSTDNGKPGTPSSTYHVSLKQDDVQSNMIAVTVYDDACLDCFLNQGLALCSQKPNTCIINGYCFRRGESHPRNCCKKCLPFNSTTDFTITPGNKPPVMHSGEFYYVLLKGQTWEFDFTAGDPERCSIKIAISGPDATWFRASTSASGGHIEMVAEEMGLWIIWLAAEDECGAALMQRLVLLVTEPAKAGGALDFANCTDNHSPVFYDMRKHFKLVHNEAIKLNIKVKDVEEHPVSFMVISSSNVQASISQEGVFRYTAENRDLEDDIIIIAEDACGARSYMRLTIDTVTCPCKHGYCVSDPKLAPGLGYKLCECDPGYHGEKCRRQVTSEKEMDGHKLSKSANGM